MTRRELIASGLKGLIGGMAVWAMGKKAGAGPAVKSALASQDQRVRRDGKQVKW